MAIKVTYRPSGRFAEIHCDTVEEADKVRFLVGPGPWGSIPSNLADIVVQHCDVSVDRLFPDQPETVGATRGKSITPAQGSSFPQAGGFSHAARTTLREGIERDGSRQLTPLGTALLVAVCLVAGIVWGFAASGDTRPLGDPVWRAER